tara:strand:+ start:652 stop:825 length:174 start_codon:yes stop_codon:yes gene_type:complete
MVAFILGLSLMFNVIFICLLIYGQAVDRRMKREIKEILRSTKTELPTEFYKEWMYSA